MPRLFKKHPEIERLRATEQGPENKNDNGASAGEEQQQSKQRYGNQPGPERAAFRILR